MPGETLPGIKKRGGIMPRVNPKWMKIRQAEIEETPHKIDVTISYNAAAQWLITELTNVGIPYKLHQLGAGVKRITTKDIDICPCCKQLLAGKK